MIGALRKTLYKLRGSTRFARFEQLTAMQYRTTEELQAEQLELLRGLLRHAHATVPFYRASFKKAGIAPDDIRSFDDFTAVPTVSRQDIESHGADMLSAAFPADRLIPNSSGGTTGKPVRFYQDKKVYTEMEANILLFLSFAGWTPDDMVVNIWGNPRDCLSARVPTGLKPWLAGSLLLNAYHYDTQTLDLWLKAIRRYRRVFLYGYASVIAALAERAMESGNPVMNVAGVITTAEKLYPSHRQAIANAFGCLVHDQYGSREAPGVACECEKGGMHLITHSAYAEFVPLEPGQAHADDAPQRILLTPLSNQAMPLIRYEIGDFGRPSDGPCPCGRGYPLMNMDIGRIGSSLVLPDGSRLYSTMFVRQMYSIGGVEVFQFRQTSSRQVFLYVVRGREFNEGSAQKLDALQHEFPQKICPGVSLAVRYVDEVPRTEGGKHRQVVCEVAS